MSTAAPLILVVEDELPLRRLLRTSLAEDLQQPGGYRLAEAETGRQALRLAAQQPPDLVILDLGLPDMDAATGVAGTAGHGIASGGAS